MTTIKRTTTLAVVALALACSVSAEARPRDRIALGVRIVPRAYVGVSPFFNPLWGPYYRYYPYSAYPFVVRPTADVRVEVVPKQAEVFVDGFYAGTAGDFDGVFKRLHTTPGGHAITLYLEGYRTVTENVYVRPDSTFKMRDTMDKLSAGETSTPPPLPERRFRSDARPAGTSHEG